MFKCPFWGNYRNTTEVCNDTTGEDTWVDVSTNSFWIGFQEFPTSPILSQWDGSKWVSAQYSVVQQFHLLQVVPAVWNANNITLQPEAIRFTFFVPTVAPHNLPEPADAYRVVATLNNVGGAVNSLPPPSRYDQGGVEEVFEFPISYPNNQPINILDVSYKFSTNAVIDLTNRIQLRKIEVVT